MWKHQRRRRAVEKEIIPLDDRPHKRGQHRLAQLHSFRVGKPGSFGRGRRNHGGILPSSSNETRIINPLEIADAGLNCCADSLRIQQIGHGLVGLGAVEVS